MSLHYLLEGLWLPAMLVVAMIPVPFLIWADNTLLGWKERLVYILCAFYWAWLLGIGIIYPNK